MKTKTGFTLVEMLVVIVILTILATLLFPALGRSREIARTAKCAVNLKQLHQAFKNAEIDGKTVCGTCSWDQDDDTLQWSHYHGWVAWTSRDRCTNVASHANGVYAWYGPTGLASVTNGALYAYANNSTESFLCPSHTRICKVNDPYRSYSSTITNSFSSPEYKTRTIIFSEDADLIGPSKPDSDGLFITNNISKIHSGKANVMYLDGHLEQW